MRSVNNRVESGERGKTPRRSIGKDNHHGDTNSDQVSQSGQSVRSVSQVSQSGQSFSQVSHSVRSVSQVLPN